MKKKLFILFIALIPASGITAKSIKVKITELRQAIADYAESEDKSLSLLKELDERISQLENRYTGYNTLKEDICTTTKPTETFLDKRVCADETGNNTFQPTYTRVKEQLEEGIKYAQEVLQQASEKKDQLIQKAKESYQDAKTAANHLIAETKNRGTIFINETLKPLFNLEYDEEE